MKTVAIIGGGFSGTMTAVNLSRLSSEPLRAVIVNTRRPLGRGTAYGTNRPEHLLNVVARNMSALPDFPLHFVDWLRSRHEFAHLSDEELREMFAPRRIYGDYLRSLLAACQNPIDARNPVKVETVDGEAVDIVVEAEDRAQVLLRDGGSIAANQVVLATGNQPPGAFPSSSPLRFDDRWCADPWDDWQRRLPPPGGCIVLLGAGLTMVDVVLTLGALEWVGRIVAISRHGMLPRSHFRGIAYQDYIPADAETLGLEGLRRLIEQHCGRLQQMSQNPAIAIDKLRPHTQRLWRSLNLQEKREFLERHAATWNVIRHRIAASIHDVLTDALDCGRLEIVSGAIQEIQPREHAIDVLFRDAKGREGTRSGELVINCTGPQARFSKTPLALFENLLRRGLIQSDELDLGIAVSDDLAVLDARGEPSPQIYAVGPLLKGTLWETTAVPELRVQALRVAETLLQRQPAEVPAEDFVEYYI